jgi:hypothetical protein
MASTVTSRVLEQLTERAAAAGWSRWRVVQELSVRERVSLLAAHRLVRGWTLGQAVAHLAELPGENGRGRNAVTAQMLCAWERGRVAPSLANLDLLCRLYQTRADHLGLAGDYSDPAPEETAAAAAQVAADEAVLRRFAAAGGVVPTARIMAVSTGVRSRIEDLLARADEPVDWDRWEEGAQAHDRRLVVDPGPTVLADVMNDLVAAQHLLGGDPSERHRRRISRLITQLGTMTAISMVGLGEYAEADSWYRMALTSAQSTGDRDLQSWVWTHRAALPILTGDPGLGLARARIAVQVANRGPASVWAHAMAARALAFTGQSRAALRELGAAETMFARHDPGAAVGISRCTEHMLAWHQAQVHVRCSDLRTGLAAADTALAQTPTDHPFTVNVVLGERAVGLVRDGQIEQACRTGQQVLHGLPPQLRGGVVRAVISEVLDTVPPRLRDLPCVRELASGLTGGAVATPLPTPPAAVSPAPAPAPDEGCP